MASKSTKTTKKPAANIGPKEFTPLPGNIGGRINLGALLSEQQEPQQDFSFWLVGDTPLICHSWSQKAKLEILEKQLKSVKSAQQPRDPEQDFLDSLYEMTRDKKSDKAVFGFPITAVKKAIWSCAHKDRGIAKVDVQSALFLDAEIVRVRPALASAICDMPLVRLWGSEPECREDMVRIGSGIRKTANLAYRAQFSHWAIRCTGSINPLLVPAHALVFLTRQAGRSQGLGDWRNEKGGWAGAFHIADLDEGRDWDWFAIGKAPMPTPKRRAAPPPITDLEAAE